jgi:hypothetical protein
MDGNETLALSGLSPEIAAVVGALSRQDQTIRNDIQRMLTSIDDELILLRACVVGLWNVLDRDNDSIRDSIKTAVLTATLGADEKISQEKSKRILEMLDSFKI